MTPRADPLPAKALERLVRDAVLAGKFVRIKDGDREIVFNAETQNPADGFDMVDLRR